MLEHVMNDLAVFQNQIRIIELGTLDPQSTDRQSGTVGTISGQRLYMVHHI